MNSDTPAAANQVSKKRQRFRSRSEKVVTAIFTVIDRLEALAATQSYDITTSDIDDIKVGLDKRITTAFDALYAVADRVEKPKPSTQPFSFGGIERAQ